MGEGQDWRKEVSPVPFLPVALGAQEADVEVLGKHAATMQR